MGWISVNEQHAPLSTDVWLWNGEKVQKGYSYGVDFMFSGNIIQNVTHWREIAEEPPAPPKKWVRKEVYASSVEILPIGYSRDCLRSILALLPPDAMNIKVSFDTEEK